MPPRKKNISALYPAGGALPGICTIPAPRLSFADCLVLGIDEAGRGCLAGPVVAAAVLLPAPCPLEGLADSKVLSAAKREALAPEIKACALAWGLGVMWQQDIDKINILQATFAAMSRAAASLALRHARAHKEALGPCLLHIDGNKTIPPHVLQRHWPTPTLPRQEALVDGDALEAHISAASILAKTFRDKIMCALHKRWPGYNFAKHKGYGTAEHLAALRLLGPCPLHRLSFAKVLPDNGPKKAKQGDLL